MQVKILAKEIIKPSSPTPSHLKTFKLSLLDQLSPVLYIPFVFFYHLNKRNNDDDPYQKNAISTLKTSLSETLSHFPLLAGRIINRSVDCNDDGALYTEATVDCSMIELLKDPNFEMLGKLLPCYPSCPCPIEEYAQIVAQLNTFKCGGIAISVCFLHKLADATTMSCFLRSWASVNKGSFDSPPKDSCSDNYKALSSLFLQTEFLPFHPRINKTITPNSERTSCFQRFVFDAKALSALKERAKSISVPNPTCVEVVTSFIWKYAMEAASVRFGSPKPSALIHALNLRKRMEPPLPEFSVGNIFWMTISQYEEDRVPIELNELVSILRESFEEINSSYIQKLTGDEGIREVSKVLKEARELFSRIPNILIFSSWRNMNLNEVDFGWGKPIWVSIAGPPSIARKNVVVLLDTISGDGIEAWMLLDEDEIKLLKQNPQFLEFALINPSISLP